MSLKKLFTVLLGIQFMLVVVLMVVTLLLFQNQKDLNKSRTVHFNSYLLADELRQSSDDLTHMARAYVVTGNAEFKRDYQTILDIRNGKSPRPVSYNRIYWDFEVATGQKPRPDGETISLHDLMIKEGFTKAEFEKLSLAQKNSDGLVKTEMIAMNAVKGLYDDGSGNFRVKKKNNREMAIRIMFDKAYYKAKAEIMKPIDEFYVMFQKRTTTDVAKYEQRSLDLLWVSIALIIIIMGMFIMSFFAIERQITKRIHSEEALSESEERFRSLYENSTIGIYRTTPDGKIILANPALIKMLGCSSFEELAERNLEQDGFEPNYERKQFLEQIEKNGEVLGLESAWMKKDGSFIYVRESARANRDSSGQTLYYDGTVEDITERKRAEEILKESEDRYHDLVENSSDLICTHDLDGNILSVNNAAIKITGYSQEELLKMNLQSLLVPEYRNLFNTYLAKIKTNGHDNGLMTIQTKTGERRIWEYNNTLRTQGVAKSIVRGMVKDITERKKNEEIIRKSENKYRSIFENIQDVYYETSIDGTILEVSPSIEGLTKRMYKREDLIGKSMYDFYSDPNERDVFIEQLKNRKSLFDYEIKLRNRDNTELPCSTTSSIKFNAEGKPEKIIGSIRDITERKRAEEALLENELKYRTLVEQSPDGIFIMDLSGKFLSVNKTMCDNLKYTDSELLSMNIWDIVPQKYLSVFKERLTAIQKRERLDNAFEYEAIGKDGVLHNIEVLSAPYYKEKNLVGFQGIARDITERKRTEASLRESEEKFRNIFENSTVGNIITQIDGRIITNQAFSQMIGYSIDELSKLTWQTITHPEDVERDKEMYDFLISKEKKSAQWEKRYLHKSGSTVWANISTILQRNSDGKPLYFITSIIDITERKLAQDKLIASEVRYRRLFESAKDGILILDAETGKIVDVNPFLIKLLGYSKEQFLEKEIWEIGFFKDVVANKEKFLELQKKGYVRYEDLPLETTDGRKINVEFVSNVYLVNKHKVFQCNIRDITERKHAEEEIRKLYRGVHQSPAAVVITDKDGNIEYVNNKFLEITGYSISEVIGKNPRILQSGEKTKEEYAELWNTILAGKEWRGELHNKKKNGELYWENSLISPIKNERGDITNFIAIKEDITERKKMIEELIESKSKAEESDKLKSEFLAQMSHEIRTPINAILGNVGYLNDEFGDNINPDTRESFEGIDLASKRIIRTVDLILNVSELKTSGYKPHFIKVNLNSEVLKKLYKEHQPSAKQKGLEFIYTSKEKDTTIIADHYSITQIFANLIDNAIKYTKKGKVEILLEKNKIGHIVVDVRDTGIGISKEFLPRLFEPFVQEEHGYTRSYDGSGLGLALVKNYCDINDAVIEVESEKNVGSTFRVTFKG